MVDLGSPLWSLTRWGFRRVSIAHGVPPRGGKPLCAGDPYPLYGERKKTTTPKRGSGRKGVQMRKRNKTIAIRCTEDEYNRVHRRAAELRKFVDEYKAVTEMISEVLREVR